MCIDLEREEEGDCGGERQTDRHRCKRETSIASQKCPTGDGTCNLGMCPDWELNLQPFGVQNNAPTNRQQSHPTRVNVN